MATMNVPSFARKSFPAGSASLQQYQFCALNSSGQLITPGNASSGTFAVILDDAPSLSGSTTTNDFQTGGFSVGTSYGCIVGPCIAKVIAGATLSAFVSVMTDLNGHAIAATSGSVVLGWTMTAASSGDYVQILMEHAYHN